MDKCQLNFNNSLNDGQYSKNLNKREIFSQSNLYLTLKIRIKGIKKSQK